MSEAAYLKEILMEQALESEMSGDSDCRFSDVLLRIIRERNQFRGVLSVDVEPIIKDALAEFESGNVYIGEFGEDILRKMVNRALQNPLAPHNR